MNDLAGRHNSNVDAEKLKQIMVMKIVFSDQDNEDLTELLNLENKQLLAKYEHLVSKNAMEELSNMKSKLNLKTQQVNVYVKQLDEIMDALGIEKCFAHILPAIQNLKKSNENDTPKVDQAFINPNTCSVHDENVICID